LIDKLARRLVTTIRREAASISPWCAGEPERSNPLVQLLECSIAVVVPSAERALIAHQAAQASGANVRTFTDLRKAGKWLKAEG
jgi:hypothetical protein